MRLDDQRESEYVEDRRDQDAPVRMGLPGGAVGGGLGVGGLVVVALLALFFGIDPRDILQGTVPDQSPQISRPVEPHSGGQEDPQRQFVARVLGSTEDTWSDLFRRAGETYNPPRLVLFTDAVRSACGIAQSAVGPFYCPGDHQVYLDLGFFSELKSRFQAPGDFAQAYVIAHEVGHHIQSLLGISEQVRARQRGASQGEANALSVRLELQADCFAGMWANHADQQHRILEDGDIDEGIRAAGAIGDDRLQKQARGYVVPDSFTHGSSAQRIRWFRTGYQQGTFSSCDTFNTTQP